MVTQERLKELFRYNPRTGNFRRKKGIPGAGENSIAGSNSRGYVAMCVDFRKYFAHRLAWLYFYGYMPEHEIDHIDRNRGNNSISNLREITHQCNLRNVGNWGNNSSGVKGVYFSNQKSKWIARIKVNKKTYHLCISSDFDEAVFHRLAAEQCFDWHGCDSSSPAFSHCKKIAKGIK